MGAKSAKKNLGKNLGKLVYSDFGAILGVLEWPWVWVLRFLYRAILPTIIDQILRKNHYILTCQRICQDFSWQNI